MKVFKRLLILTSILGVFALAGCSGNKDTTDGNKTKATTKSNTSKKTSEKQTTEKKGSFDDEVAMENFVEKVKDANYVIKGEDFETNVYSKNQVTLKYEREGYADYAIMSVNEEVFQDNIESQQIVVWRGLAYENVAFNHISQLKEALGIRSVSTIESTFYDSFEKDSAQIDMVIERKDNIVNMCEIKFYSDLYVCNKNSHLDLIRKNRVLSEFIKKKQTIHNTLITTYGIKDNEYRFDYMNVITLDELFK